jgi:hypothetical protein
MLRGLVWEWVKADDSRDKGVFVVETNMLFDWINNNTKDPDENDIATWRTWEPPPGIARCKHGFFNKLASLHHK